ncbi:MAG: carbamoyltransferase HypF [Zoogloeaceae bacterium]|jgi:hydrogenase maturation protein HypF|nr:carbamoyltransferase HypF [Zoogloeaceae bacterium]
MKQKRSKPSSACRVLISGLVQGVGFRPFVWHLANEYKLCGWVKNVAAGVEIHLEGEPAKLEEFLARLPQKAPLLSRIDRMTHSPAPSLGAKDFAILATEEATEGTSITIGPDLGICPDCLAELFNPASPRYRYPLIACTRCGPRYSVTRHLPYCREATTLAPYPLCPDCASEYGNPADRRFHAEATACPRCGPEHFLLDSKGERLDEDPASGAWARIEAGEIIAIKGLGGFHLVCDATNFDAVATLRQRKLRDAKPFALMAANRASLAQWVEFDEPAAHLLESEARPILLLPRKQVAPSPLNGVAPGLDRLGVMLPATPMHWLLFHAAAGKPEGMKWLEEAQATLLIMTSANPGGEPVLYRDEAAIEKLAGVADAFWLHRREIVTPVDDSLLLPMLAESAPPIFIRRARGYTPKAIFLSDSLSDSAPDVLDVLALGGYLKNTVCLTRGREAFLSQHIGSLDNAATIRFLERTLAHLCQTFAIKPAAIAHDLHPDFPSTRLALELAEKLAIPAFPIAHHHAHIAAVCAEHQIPPARPVLGLALDGFGLGTDGTLWGGELLRVEGASCRRLGHLSPLPLPGGEMAAREPWRMAVALLYQSGEKGRIASWLKRRFPDQNAAPLMLMLEKGINVPQTTSLGRLFDAAAALLGIASHNRFEAEAAMLLESLATPLPCSPPEPLYRVENDALDLSPLLLSLVEENNPAEGAARFHQVLALALSDWAIAQAKAEKIEEIALAGGCLQNALLSRQMVVHLERAGLRPLLPQAVPPGDGGLALGQAWIARELAK